MCHTLIASTTNVNVNITAIIMTGQTRQTYQRTHEAGVAIARNRSDSIDCCNALLFFMFSRRPTDPRFSGVARDTKW